jgi:sialic acid synthase SpsE
MIKMPNIVPKKVMFTPVHIIAEAGTNHNGSVANGKRLIDLAARAKADTVKFQIIDPEYLYLPGQYEFGHYEIDTVRATRKRFMLTDAEYRELFEYARADGVPFTASVFDPRGIDFLASLGPP